MNLIQRHTRRPTAEGVYLRRNPLRWVAAVTTVSLCFGVYKIISTWQFSAAEIGSMAIAATFLVSFLQKLRVAWLISIVAYACVPLLNVAKNREFFTVASQWQVRLMALAVWFAWLGYLLYTRKPYYLYLEKSEE